MQKPMIDITADLDDVHGGNQGAAGATQTQPPQTSFGVVNPVGSSEARGISCLPLPAGEGGYPAGSWICRETGQVQPIPGKQ